MNGIDTTDPATNAIPCLKHNGVQFVFRYVSPNTENFPAKLVTREEALALSAAGIALACVYEMLPVSDVQKRAHFTFDQGVADAKFAYDHLAKKLGAPKGTAIYFAVDYDTTEREDQTIIAVYFAGVRHAFDYINASLPNVLNIRGYMVGAYASGATLDYLFENGLIDYKWVTLSQGFRGSRGYKNWDVRQIEEKTVCGLDADTNEAKDSFGQFMLSAPQVPVLASHSEDSTGALPG